ncbi:MAG: PBP1A family penicillin-binding protein [Pseudomonadota bacterium]|nr:PBP1A family penicillin-binding protein [Pseudomonadota bacterium]
MKRFILLTILTLTLFIIGIFSWLLFLNKTIASRLKERQFAPPIELYSAPEKIIKGQTLQKDFLSSTLVQHKYRQRDEGQILREGDYAILDLEQCLQVLPESLPDGVQKCVYIHKATTWQLIAIGEKEVVVEIFEGEKLEPKLFIELEPELFAQFYGNTPVIRRLVKINDTPPICLEALLAIEDSGFLEHRGFSVGGMARAMWRNIRRGSVSEGGSTLTQQLVKNYYLTSERTIKRKITEIGMALVLEAHVSKDDILETYLNVIYMGQNGPFQIRGYGSAARHYFSKDLEELNLSECALMAAIVNGPGIFNPFTKPEKALARRKLVLERMVTLKKITQTEFSEALATKLPNRPPAIQTETAPYFVDAVMNQMVREKIDTEKGLRVYTTLNRRAQFLATSAAEKGLDKLERDFKKIKERKEKGNLLETCLISADPNSGYIQALVGGRGYKVSQFNRAIMGHRQVGSIMKPVVFLTALEGLTPEGNPYTPLTIIEDKEFNYRYEGQKWSPQNYDKKFRNNVPLYVALKDSLNAATANLGIQVGLPSVIDVARRLGVDSKLLPVPSITLGAFELFPIEVLKAYTTISRQGSKIDLSFIRHVEDLEGNKVYSHNYKEEPSVSREDATVLTGMMKQTLQTGSGRAAKYYGFTHPAAGKTGTTSDTKDAWFAGFTPYHVAIVWIGYDNNESHGLTGASGALPIWAEYMKNYAGQYPPIDFPLPDGVVNATVPFTPPPQDDGKKTEWPESIELYFKSGTEPGAELDQEE